MYVVPRVSLILALLTTLSWRAEAAEYFVHPRGNDVNDGLTRERAFRTVQKGVDALKPGETLTIGPGEYRETVRREKLGSLEAETIIRAEIPGTVLLRGDVPAPEFRKLDGARFTWVADFDATEPAQSVNEVDTLKILERMPNVSELEFLPGVFFQDVAARKLYISTTELAPVTTHRYTVCMAPTHGLYLLDARRVKVEGIAATGYNAARSQPTKEYALNATWGIFIANGKSCVIRNCHAYLNGQGIGTSSHKEENGDNVIEHCSAWGNYSRFGAGDKGGITIVAPRRDVVRHCTAFLNGEYGINIRGAGGSLIPADNDPKNKSLMQDCIAWGNWTDFKIKTGGEYVHRAERCASLGRWSLNFPIRCLMGENSRDYTRDNILLVEEEKTYPQREFADPENNDYRLQATSRFRGAGPDGSDRGPYPFAKNVFHVRPDGDDAADGLSVKGAWKTLARAVKGLRPGDTLYIQPGVYAEKLDLTLTGEPGKPISVRGRGRGLAVIEGPVTIKEGHDLDFQRVQFSSAVRVERSGEMAFTNCQFTALDTAFESSDVTGLAVTHCTFTGFQKAAVSLARSFRVRLSGNLFDNRNGAAVRLDDPAAVLYSVYNSYRRASEAWEVAGAKQSLAEVQKRCDTLSREIIPEFATMKGTAVLQNAAAFSAAGSMGTSFGVCAVPRSAKELRIASNPVVHSVSATTANLEWMTTMPATCKLAWGETPACANTLLFEANCFGAYSLTGLKPGHTYHFRILEVSVPSDLVKYGGVDAAIVKVDLPPVSLITPAQDAPPAIYYVAPDGNDANDGTTRQTALRTVQRAADLVNVGDTVQIAGGRYVERVRIRATGAEAGPITFKCLSGEKATLVGGAQELNNALVSGGKSHLRFDGLYFANYNREPLQGALSPRTSGEINLYAGRDIRISRCFSEGRGGDFARTVTASEISGLTITNCVTMNKMSGAMQFERCPSLRVEHCVFARPMIQSFVLRNKADEPANMDHNIFTDNLQKKAALNIPFLCVDGAIEGFRQVNNCYVLRAFTPETRVMNGTNSTLKDLRQYIIDPLFADPLFAGDPGVNGNPADKSGFAPDRMMDAALPLDFDSFFATNPEVLKRGIGLQPEAFKDFRFIRRDAQEK